MSLRSFDIYDTGPIEKMQHDGVPDLMVIAGPNGVGKSTLLEEIRDSMDTPTTSDSVVVEGETSCVYYSPYRAPTELQVSERQLLEMDDLSSRELLSAVSLENISRENELPRRVYGDRGRGQPDFLPYHDVKRRMAQIEMQVANRIHEKYKSDHEVPEDYIPDYEKQFAEAVESVLPGVSYDRVEKQSGEYNITFVNRLGEQITFDDLSSGERDVVSLLFFIISERNQ